MCTLRGLDFDWKCFGYVMIQILWIYKRFSINLVLMRSHLYIISHFEFSWDNTIYGQFSLNISDFVTYSSEICGNPFKNDHELWVFITSFCNKGEISWYLTSNIHEISSSWDIVRSQSKNGILSSLVIEFNIYFNWFISFYANNRVSAVIEV